MSSEYDLSCGDFVSLTAFQSNGAVLHMLYSTDAMVAAHLTDLHYEADRIHLDSVDTYGDPLMKAEGDVLGVVWCFFYFFGPVPDLFRRLLLWVLEVATLYASTP